MGIHLMNKNSPSFNKWNLDCSDIYLIIVFCDLQKACTIRDKRHAILKVLYVMISLRKAYPFQNWPCLVYF